MVPNGVIHITDQLAVMKKDGDYFNGHMPVLSHGENDTNTFRTKASYRIEGAAFA